MRPARHGQNEYRENFRFGDQLRIARERLGMRKMPHVQSPCGKGKSGYYGNRRGFQQRRGRNARSARKGAVSARRGEIQSVHRRRSAYAFCRGVQCAFENAGRAARSRRVYSRYDGSAENSRHHSFPLHAFRFQTDPAERSGRTAEIRAEIGGERIRRRSRRRAGAGRCGKHARYALARRSVRFVFRRKTYLCRRDGGARQRGFHRNGGSLLGDSSRRKRKSDRERGKRAGGRKERGAFNQGYIAVFQRLRGGEIVRARGKDSASARRSVRAFKKGGEDRGRSRVGARSGNFCRGGKRLQIHHYAENHVGNRRIEGLYGARRRRYFRFDRADRSAGKGVERRRGGAWKFSRGFRVRFRRRFAR